MLNLLRSRKFWLTIIGIASAIAGKWFGVDDATITKYTELIMLLVGAIAIEDAAKKLGARK